MLNVNIKKLAIIGVMWSAIDRLFSQVVQLLVSIMLARMLTPEDFGLIGMLLIFLMVSDVFVDSGFSQALIQKKNRTEVDYSTAFYTNIFIAILIYSVLYFSAPAISDFYSTPELTNLSRLLFLSLLINSFSVVQNAKLTIDMNFKMKAKLNFLAVSISGFFAVYLARSGWGVWALAWQAVTRSIVYAILLIAFERWKPALAFSVESFNSMFKFGSKLLVGAIFGTVVNNLYALLIGRFFSSQTVGYYIQAKKHPTLLANTIDMIINGVTYPVLTSVQDDRERLASIYRRIFRMTCFAVIPIMAGFGFLSESFVALILGEKWLPIVFIMKVFCVIGIFASISKINMCVLNAIGRSDLYLKLDLIRGSMLLVSLLLTAPYGLNYVVLGLLIVSFIFFFANAYYPYKLFGYGAFEQIKDIAPTVASVLLMLVAVDNISMDHGFLYVLAVGIVGTGVYLVASFGLKNKSMMELTYLVKSKVTAQNS